MVPQIKFIAWLAANNEYVRSEDITTIDVDLEDRALVREQTTQGEKPFFFISRRPFVHHVIYLIFSFKVILRTNKTEISHSMDSIGIEVFAEPNSQVCVYGSQIPQGEGKKDTFTILLIFNHINPFKIKKPLSNLKFYPMGV